MIYLQKMLGPFGENKRMLNEVPIDFLHSDFDQKQVFMDRLLKDHVKTGFLMVFCESQFCTENIYFIVAVSEYKNLFLDDRVEWEDYKTLDAQENPEELHQFDAHRAKVVEKQLKTVFDGGLSPTAEYEVCISQAMLARIQKRMDKYKIYGPGVFDEALVDPKATLLKDILPRFVVSSTYEDMLYYLDKRKNLPSFKTLHLPPPEEAMDTSASKKKHLRNMLSRLLSDVDCIDYCSDDLDNYFIDPMLYEALLKYLKRIVCSENLLCVRAINIYLQMFDNFMKQSGGAKVPVLFSTAAAGAQLKSAAAPIAPSGRGRGRGRVTAPSSTSACNDNSEEMSAKLMPHVDIVRDKITKENLVNQAWVIYLYFLASDSCYEIGGVSCSLHQKVSRAMASPSRDTFNTIREIAYKALEQSFNAFKETSEFEQLVEAVLKRTKDQEHHASVFESTKVVPKKSCFEF